ncbi:MAG: alpha/beta hydrolase [Verrucomicrobiota bacterium]
MHTSHLLALFLASTLSTLSHAADSPPQTEKISLWANHAPIGDGSFQTADPTITVHHPSHPNGTAVVICPGGGYGGLVTGPEGHGIATWLNAHNITGVVLEYRLPHGHPFIPLLDAQRAIRIVRSHAKDWALLPNRIGICGFSAGGHLASTAGTHFDSGDLNSSDPIAQFSSRPDFLILIYPVITLGDKGHQGSKVNLLGPNPSPELVDLFSNQKQITDKTPPTFLAHALDDRVVPPENSLWFYQTLQEKKLPAKYLELPTGGHGLNGYRGPSWDAWQTQSLIWLADSNLIPQADASIQSPK